MNTPLVEKWKFRLDKAHSTFKKWSDTFMTQELDKYWEGQQRPAWWNEEFFVPINLLYANIQGQLDAFVATTPQFHVRPARTFSIGLEDLEALDKQVDIRQALLNSEVRTSEFKRETAKVRLDAELSCGVVKTWYQPYHELNADGEEFVASELFKVGRRNFQDIRMDPYADSYENITWIAERIQYKLSEVKANKLFKNTEDLKPFDIIIDEKKDEKERKIGSDMATPLTGGNSSLPQTMSLEDPDKEIVWVWEIYDLEEKKLVCIAEGYDKELRDEAIPAGIKKHPYILMWFIDRRNSALPIPAVWHQIGPQDEYNVTRNQIMLHRRRFNRKYTMRKGAVDPEEQAKIENPYDGVVITVNQDGEVIRPIQDMPLDQAVYFDTSMLRKDFMDVAGETVPDSEIAQIEKATVASFLANRQETRKRGKLAVIQDFYSEIANKLMALYEAEMSLPVAITMTGIDGYVWKPISAEDVTATPNAEFVYEVAISSLIPLSPETERANFIGFLEILTRNPLIGANAIILMKTARMFGIEDKQLIAEFVNYAQQTAERQMLTGGQSGQPSMSPDMAQALGVPRG